MKAYEREGGGGSCVAQIFNLGTKLDANGHTGQPICKQGTQRITSHCCQWIFIRIHRTQQNIPNCCTWQKCQNSKRYHKMVVSLKEYNKWIKGSIKHVSTGRLHMMVIYSTSFEDEETRTYTNTINLCDDMNEPVQQNSRLHFPMRYMFMKKHKEETYPFCKFI